MVSKPNVVSLFSGAGGLDYGFEAAGFHTTVALELDPDCCRTLEENRSWTVLPADALTTPTKVLLRAGGLRKRGVDVLIGGPPCQPFSKSGYWFSGDARRLDDPRAATLSAYLRILEESLPRVFLFENVDALAYPSKSEALAYLLRSIDEISVRSGVTYRVTRAVLRAADFGVPQFRSRFFMIGSRIGGPFRFPEKTHGPKANTPYLRAWDAIGGIKPRPSEDLDVRGKWAPVLPSIPEGHNYLWHTKDGGGEGLFGWRRRYWNFLLKLAKDRPSWTIQAQPGPATGPFHWDNRRLSMRELCRLQTFPDDVEVLGSRLAIQRQLGNAVPSLLAEVLARAIGQQYFGHSDETCRLLPRRKRRVPPPRKPGPVPEPFMALVGLEDEHPGEGKGPGARKRAQQQSA